MKMRCVPMVASGRAELDGCVRLCRFVAVLLLLLSSRAYSFAADDTNGPSTVDAAKEREQCSQNLKVIYAAVEAYRRDHKDVPEWFSDLVPDYLHDVNVLVCPVSRRTGVTDLPNLLDPHIASSYLYEFSPIPLGTAAPGNPSATRREWKRRQMGIVGSIVPVVRCRHHNPVLNLAFDVRIYDSPSSWETMLTNIVDPESITPARLFATSSNSIPGPAVKQTYPPREPGLPNQLLDLSKFYNAHLSDSWHGAANSSGNELGGLVPGAQKLAGVEYDIRGIVQIGSKSPSASRFPTNVIGIKVNQKCQRLHFLHAAAFGHPADEGKEIGAYVLHFAANNMRLEVPIVYGTDARDWHFWKGEKTGPPNLKIVWKGENATSKKAGSYIRLFETTWTNVAPGVELESIDIISKLSQPAPFVLGITLE